ncbi:HIT family protein [Paenibacillus roseipurpureus]|uniref:HIT family protein n=1 Tax=Paenibacillus roseopurpureus TaxID=2918901 RepID=UPI0028E4CFD3|nr:HIT family protein [Paenibacillus sp. MBLB1832]
MWSLLNCPYCNISNDNRHEVIMSNESCTYTLLKEQEIKGAGIIVPKEHRETVFDLTQDEWNETFQLLQEVKLYLDQNYKPDGYNVGWNCGHVGGQHVFHSHLHVIPRYADESMAGKGIRYLFKKNQKVD